MSSEFETLRKFRAEFESTAEDRQRARERSERVKRELGLPDLNSATPAELVDAIRTCRNMAWKAETFLASRGRLPDIRKKNGVSAFSKSFDECWPYCRAGWAARKHAQDAAGRVWAIARGLGLATEALESLIGDRRAFYDLGDKGWDRLLTEAQRVAVLAEGLAYAQAQQARKLAEATWYYVLVSGAGTCMPNIHCKSAVCKVADRGVADQVSEVLLVECVRYDDLFYGYVLSSDELGPALCYLADKAIARCHALSELCGEHDPGPYVQFAYQVSQQFLRTKGVPAGPIAPELIAEARESLEDELQSQGCDADGDLGAPEKVKIQQAQGDAPGAPAGGGMSWQRAMKLAEDHCRHNPFPGVRPLAKIIGCSPSTMHRAVMESALLRNKRRDEEAPVTAGESAATHASYVNDDPAESLAQRELVEKSRAIDADPLLQRLMAQATPVERQRYLEETPIDQLKELAVTVYHDPHAGQRLRGCSR